MVREVRDPVTRATSSAACLSGQITITAGASDFTIHHTGRPTISIPVPDIGTCRTNGTHIVASILQATDVGPRAIIHLYTSTGERLWTRTVKSSTVPDIDPTLPMVAVANNGVVELVGVDGNTRMHFDGYVDAKYTTSGRLALLSASGALRWFK